MWTSYSLSLSLDTILDLYHCIMTQNYIICMLYFKTWLYQVLDWELITFTGLCWVCVLSTALILRRNLLLPARFIINHSKRCNKIGFSSSSSLSGASYSVFILLKNYIVASFCLFFLLFSLDKKEIKSWEEKEKRKSKYNKKRNKTQN